MGAPVIHWEIISPNSKELVGFYSELFDWNIDTNNPQGYGLVDTQSDRGIPGGIGDPQQGESRVTFYVSVPDPQKTLDKAEEMGGKTVLPPMAVEGADPPVTLAMFLDPHGHLVGLTKA
jgi:predicted enzyme related to lactoylglutathione lyase